jgi:hypothetical protein
LLIPLQPMFLSTAAFSRMCQWLHWPSTVNTFQTLLSDSLLIIWCPLLLGWKSAVEGVNASMIYLMHCKNLCKCYDVPPPSTTIIIKYGTHSFKFSVALPLWHWPGCLLVFTHFPPLSVLSPPKHLFYFSVFILDIPLGHLCFLAGIPISLNSRFVYAVICSETNN